MKKREVARRLARNRAHGDNERGHDQPAERELLADPVEPLLERRPLDRHALEQDRYPAELGRHAGGHDHAGPAAVGDLGAGVGHAAAVAEREVVQVDGR